MLILHDINLRVQGSGFPFLESQILTVAFLIASVTKICEAKVMLYLPAKLILIPESGSKVTPFESAVVLSGMGSGAMSGITKSVVS